MADLYEKKEFEIIEYHKLFLEAISRLRGATELIASLKALSLTYLS